MIALFHLTLLPDAPPGAPCVVCGEPRPGFGCERCGVLFHSDCYWSRVATAAERVEIERVEQDPATLIFLCRGCRQ
jgi:hypothetical protein